MGTPQTDSMSKRPADDSDSVELAVQYVHLLARQAREAHKRARKDIDAIAHMANTSVARLTCPETCVYVKVLPPSLVGYCCLRFTPCDVYWHDKVASVSEFNSHIMVRPRNTDWVRVLSMRIKTETTCEVVFPHDETPCDYPTLEIEFIDDGVMDKETDWVSLTGQPYVDSSSSGSDSPPTDDDASSDSE